MTLKFLMSSYLEDIMQDKVFKLQKLTGLFKQNEKQYKSANYDEANTRVDFIDKFFELLDWDVSNTQGFAENYREVVREDKIIIEGKPKAPDYSFRIGGFRKFFVEAKKPDINIKDDLVPAYQVRRYGYTAKVPLSILTDFEEFSIYDTRIKPNKNDKASVGRIFYCSYDEYIKNFDFIYNSFSKNAILKGSFDKYVEENKNKKGTSEVDKEFLSLIENWRNSLAKNIALRNIDLSIYELNYAVQKIIDRIIFLRIAEDRQMEEYNTLKDTTKNESIYRYLNKVFKTADDKYNSGLFKKEKFFDDLKIDDKVLKPILTGLYYPDCPYEFSIFSTEILGNVYEQFLGKTIRLTSSHQAKVEEKPEVRKVGGVYYTPQYIVDYIVQNTVGEKIKDKTLTQIKKLKICDPACGSGSFLIGAYRCLLNFHLQYYIKDENRSKASKNNCIYQISENNWALTIKEKQEILLNNIFGVDIDSQAVEVTKLSLLLKLMEGENEESAGSFFKFSDLQLLPDLSNNIKCGNSLIGNDFYDKNKLSLFADDEIRKINVFEWEKEFSSIFLNGGFDVVIGNPPYIPIELMTNEQKAYLQSRFPQLERKYDSSIIFIVALMEKLNKDGLLGYISSLTWQTGENYKKLRELLFLKYGIKTIINLPFDVFKNAYVDTGIYIFSNKNTDSYDIFRFPKKEKNPNLETIDFIQVNKSLINPPDYKIVLDPISQKIINRVKDKFTNIENITISTQGLPPSRFKINSKKNESFNSPYLVKGQIYRYIFDIEETAYTDLSNNKSLIPFYENKPKILIRRVINRQDRIMATYFDKELVFKKDINPFIITDDDYNPYFFLGLVNSKLFSYLYINTSSIATKDDFRQTTLAEIRKMPIPIFDSKNNSHKKLIELVLQILKFNSENNFRIETDKKLHLQKIKIIDNQIDNIVFTLYNLNENEINVINKKYGT